MARIHYWQYIVDDQGIPLQDVNIRLYLSDITDQEADIFTHHAFGAPTTTSIANIKTDGNGFFEFWIGDEIETGGYISTQKFKLIWQRAGIQTGEISNIEVYPPVLQVNETDNTSSTKTEKNKLVSNELAYKWDTHTDSIITDTPHNFLPVDTTKTDIEYNKFVSNNLMNYILSAIASAGTLSIAATAAVERSFVITSWSSSADAYYTVLNHFIGNEYPVVQVFKSADNFQYQPMKIKSIDTNSLEIWVTDNINTKVTIVG